MLFFICILFVLVFVLHLDASEGISWSRELGSLVYLSLHGDCSTDGETLLIQSGLGWSVHFNNRCAHKKDPSEEYGPEED
jgi:hypothetical protein